MIAKGVQFDCTRTEVALAVALAVRNGLEAEFLESDSPGGAATCHLDHIDDAKAGWQQVVTQVTQQLGVVNCDWKVKDGCNEEATFIAFDVPGLSKDCRDDHCSETYPGNLGIVSLQRK